MTARIMIDDALKEQIEALARLRERSTASLVSEALSQYVAREEAHGSFVGEAEASWAAYLRDHRHLTGHQASEWLASWGTPDEKPAPACHE